MTWTTDVPKEPGWYWMKTAKLKPEVAKIYHSEFRHGLAVARAYHDGVERLDEFASGRRGVEWAGPIPEPEDA